MRSFSGFVGFVAACSKASASTYKHIARVLPHAPSFAISATLALSGCKHCHLLKASTRLVHQSATYRVCCWLSQGVVYNHALLAHYRTDTYLALLDLGNVCLPGRFDNSPGRVCCTSECSRVLFPWGAIANWMCVWRQMSMWGSSKKAYHSAPRWRRACSAPPLSTCNT